MDDQNFDLFFQEFFQPGVVASDLPALYPLLRAREALNAFIALFRGGDDEVLVRLLVLREIGLRGESPTWSPQELRAHFAYLDEVKMQTVLHRLRQHGLLVWDGETSLYQISPAGRMALSALGTLLKFSEEEGGEIAYITSQLAAGQTLGKVSNEDLQHLLSRLNELQEEFNRAILSGSEHRIRLAEKKLSSVVKWVEKGTEIMKEIAASDELDPVAHGVAQRIGQVQSRMLRMSSVFQRTLNQLENQKVHLGESGLSTADIHRWLRTQDPKKLTRLLGDALGISPVLNCLLPDIAMDVAEFELVDRVRAAEEETALPPAQEAPAADDMAQDVEDLTDLRDFLLELGRLHRPAPLEETIPALDFATTSYRLSLAALLGDPESEVLEGAVATLARLPLQLSLTGGTVEVGRYEVQSMSAGNMVRVEEKKK